MRRIIVGTVGLLAAAALASCGGSAKPVAQQARAAVTTTTSTTTPDGTVCIQHVESPLPLGEKASEDPMCPTKPPEKAQRAQAQNRAAQSDLRNALTAEKTVYTDTQAAAPTR